jgi:hypothetical protein
MWSLPRRNASPTVQVTPGLLLLAMASVLLWMACGELPRSQSEEEGPHRQELLFLALQASATGHWSPTGSLARARGAHTTTVLRDGRLLVGGGGAIVRRRHGHRERGGI